MWKKSTITLPTISPEENGHQFFLWCSWGLVFSTLSVFLNWEFCLQFSLRQHLWWPAKWGEDLCIFSFGRSNLLIAHMYSYIAVLSQPSESFLQLTVSAKLTPSQGPVVTTQEAISLAFSWNFLRAFIYLESPLIFWDLHYLMLFLTLQKHFSSPLLWTHYSVVSVQTDMEALQTVNLWTVVFIWRCLNPALHFAMLSVILLLSKLSSR